MFPSKLVYCNETFPLTFLNGQLSPQQSPGKQKLLFLPYIFFVLIFIHIVGCLKETESL